MPTPPSTDQIKDRLLKVVDGNPGALSALFSVMEKHGPAWLWVALNGCETCGIKGSAIWVLFKDVFDGETEMLLQVLNGVELGIMEPSVIRTLSEGRPPNFDIKVFLLDIADRTIAKFPERTKDLAPLVAALRPMVEARAKEKQP